MLRSAGIRSKILALLVIPLVLLAVTAGLLASTQVSRARTAVEVEQLAELADGFAQLVKGIETERDLTVASVDESPAAAEALAQLPAVRAQVDAGLEGVRTAIAGIDAELVSEQAVVAITRATDAHEELPATRERAGSGLRRDGVAAAYNRILVEDLALPGRVGATVTGSDSGGELVGYGEILTAASFAREELRIGLSVIAGVATPTELDRFEYLVRRQDDALTRWAFVAGDERSAELLAFTGSEGDWGTALAREAVATGTPRLRGLTTEIWTAVSDQRIQVLEAELTKLSAQTRDAAAASRQQSTLLAALAVLAAVLGIGVTVLLSIVIARRIADPLRRLTVAADQARELLPVMVEQMRRPGAMPDVSLPQIEVDGDDEVARLARAFNAVNTTVVEVAQKQAVLRGAIAETFVNVARRNQVLLSRQLSFIDQLERTEENPDTLENLFRLDHLATRMRRNAESLLVLAGIDAGRRLRRPLPLSDVIRTAASEIEQYERVNLALQVDPPTIGHLSLQTAHLLAELLENATNFSEPHTPVLVATSQTETGIRIVITDEGLGLTVEEIESAQDKIRTTGTDEAVTSQRLGFFVVGRLAARLGVTVTLKRGRSKGLIAIVDLPPSLFVAGSVVVTALVLPAAAAVPAAEVPRQGGNADAGGAGPARPAASPRPAAPPARQPLTTTRRSSAARPTAPHAPIELPSAAVAGAARPAPVRVEPGSAPLPRRGQGTPVAAPTSTAPTSDAPTSDAAPAATFAPPLQQSGGAAPLAVRKPKVPTGEPTPASQPTPAPTPTAVVGDVGEATDAVSLPARTGLFGAFRARREQSSAAYTEPVRPVPAQRPQPTPVVPEAVVLQPSRPTGAPVAAPSPRPSVPDAEKRPPVPRASAPVPSVTTPLEILPGGRGRRSRNGMFHRGTAPEPVRTPSAPPAAEAPRRAPVTAEAVQAVDGHPLPRQSGPKPAADGPRRQPPSSVPVPAPVPVVVAAHAEGPAVAEREDVSAGSAVRQRSMLASEALSELSRLSAYSPSAVDGPKRPAPLTRRQPAATPAAQIDEPQPVGERRQRSASDVRSMLAGFQSGVSRGRATSPDDVDANAGPPGPADALTSRPTPPARPDPSTNH